MNKVLITGGTGFIGLPVIKELLGRGFEVHATVYPRSEAKTPDGVTAHQLDLTDAAAVSRFMAEHRFENIIHLAWYVGAKCHISDVNLDWVVATLHLLREFVNNGGRHFLGAGSCSEYEYKYGYLTEDMTPTDPGTMYGNGKNAVYNLAKVFLKQHDVRFQWTRIFNLYGPAEKPTRLMPSVINSCLKGEDVRVSDCLKFQDYLYVDDTARGIADVFESDLTGAVNICSGHPVQLRTIVNKIAELTGFTGKILWGAIPAAFGDDLVAGNNSKLKTTGWQQQYTLETGLKETIKWWREHSV